MHFDKPYVGYGVDFFRGFNVTGGGDGSDVDGCKGVVCRCVCVCLCVMIK